MIRRPASSIVANPVLVGAVTTLVVVVAVFLSYSANKGLPFVPTTELRFLVDNGANLLPGNEVREGGYRIGLVTEMEPARLPDGQIGAEVRLKLDEGSGPIPVDSTFSLRPRSVLGLKYVELTRGRSARTFADGDTVPARQARFPVELADLYEVYDERTRTGSRRGLQGFGDALTGRGASLNLAIQDAPRLLGHLEPVARSLAAPGTQLGRLFEELGDAARTVAPVARRYRHQFEAAGDVFEAWSRSPEALAATIDKSGPTYEVAASSLRRQRPFLTRFARFSGAVQEAAATLPRTLPRIIPALETGTRVQRRAPQLNEPLRETLSAVDRLSRDPVTSVAFRGLADTTRILNPVLRFVGPYITVCNYFNYAWTHAGEHISEPDPTGTSQRVLLMQASRTVNPTATSLGSLGTLSNNKPANNEPVLTGVPYAIHSQPYPAAITTDGRADCEGGQRGYLERVMRYGAADRKGAVDPRTPGVQGPTFTGRPEVPQGQTFTRTPQFGPKVPEELD
ncbi:MlaD family protein [Conexibacter sp. SYSU D00693]|uniref:MlaD family protein n=1 Tax=Conexibacter sp. SYSU D00693 TaxID=2812560 RepID=UPI00196A74FD|nr:MlaD family protein [Conexibacter sp. SYSU D00693]